MSELYGAIEAGGTKFVCAVGTGPDDIVAETRFPTDDPESTIGSATAFLADQQGVHGRLSAIGVASFGPVELRLDHSRYGWITTTPKPGWSGTPVIRPLMDAFEVPVGFDTDVNGAALGEGRWGAAQGVASFVYVTVGTGIGGGAVVDGNPLHGLVHPEMGHVPVARKPGDGFSGTCPFHGDCFEGMACGPALAQRWSIPAARLAGAHLEEARATQAWYVAQGLRAIVYMLAPQRIVLGGGVMGMPGLIELVRIELRRALAGYPGLPEHDEPNFVVAPRLGSRAGVAGAFVLAELAADRAERR